MKTSMKILVTFLVTVLLTVSFGEIAFASEIEQSVALPVQVTTTEEVFNTINTDNNENTLDTETTQDQAQINLLSNDNGDEQVQTDEVSSYVDDQGQLYIVDYIDEQGQVVYKKAEEIVIEEPIEVIEEEVEEVEEVEAVKPTETKPSYSERDLRLLSCLIYSEAGNQSYKGMLGVANVVLNRVKSDVYWHVDTVKEAIYDRKWSVQFAVTIRNKKTGLSMLDKALKCYDTDKFSGGNPGAERKAMQRAIKAAKAALQGENNIGNYLCFQGIRSANSIKKHYSDYKVIGGHIFYRTH